MHCIRTSSTALAVLLTVPVVACAGVEPSSESGATDNSSASTLLVPDTANRIVLMRPAITNDLLQASNKELMLRGYMPRPDRAKMPAAYEAWLESSSKPLHVIAPVTGESDMSNLDSTSNTWSGIVNNTPDGGYNYVYGRWTVPTVSVDSGTDTFSSTWVGIDGWRSDAVASKLWQTGTAQAITGDGAASYYAWFQLYPTQGEQRINNFAVSPGDVITAAVAILDSNGMLTNAGQIPMYYLSNDTTGTTTGWREWGSVASGEIGGQSAEWIVERPTKKGGVTSLADYGDVVFDMMAYGDSSGIFDGIDSSTSIAVAMQNRDDNNVLSQAFELSSTSASTIFYAPN